MAGGKETPRQKMIGMMYLVLTALLALNVSKEILNAFVIVDAGLVKTNAAFQGKNEQVYTAFELALMNDERKTRPYFDKAQQAKKLSKELTDYLHLLKKEIYMQVEGVPEAVADTMSLSSVNSKDNYDITTHYLIGADPSNITGKAKDLKDKIDKYRSDLLSLIDEKQRANMKIGLTTEEQYSIAAEGMVSWEQNNFYHNPVAAVITIFSKLENDIKNAEGDVINMLYNSVTAADFKFDTLAAKVIANTNYVLLGDTFKADVFVAAFSTTQNPIVTVGDVDSVNNKFKSADTTNVPTKRGVGLYKKVPTTEGLVEWGGLINVKAPDGSVKSYPFRHSYMVAKPALVVSPTKMNVLYIGVDNPLEISVPGIPAENIQPSLGGGSLSGGKGKYIARVSGGNKATVNVAAKFKDGKSRNMGSFEFRVKRIPDPVAKVGGKKGDDIISSSELKAVQGVLAELENFDFDLKFVVTSFDLSMNVKGVFVTEQSQSNRLTPAMTSLINNAKTGTKVYIENVRAKGPDGTVRKIPGVNLKIK